MTFPTTGVLDSAVRANEGPPPSASWGPASIEGILPGLKITSNKIAGATGVSGGGWWNTSFGPDSEAFCQGATPGTTPSILLYVRLLTPGTVGVSGYASNFTGSNVLFYSITADTYTQIGPGRASVVAATDWMGVGVAGQALTAYKKSASAVNWTNVASYSDPTYTAAGFLGLEIDNTGGVVNFGGGTSAPFAPPSPHRFRIGGSGAGW